MTGDLGELFWFGNVAGDLGKLFWFSNVVGGAVTVTLVNVTCIIYLDNTIPCRRRLTSPSMTSRA